MKNLIFLLMIFVIFPFVGLIALNLILDTAGVVACAISAVALIFAVIAFISHAQDNILN